MHIFLIANPVAGPSRGRLLGNQAQSLLEARGAQVTLTTTKGKGHATEVARQAAGRADLVVAIGGDGTLTETATGLLGTGCPLALLPSGSGNDFAFAQGVSDVEQGLASIFAGVTLDLDVGSLDGDLFFNSLGLLGSGLVSGTASKLWRWLGHRRYLLAGIYQVVKFKGQRLRWLAPGSEDVVIDDKFMLVEVCNGPLTGGGFRFAPDAEFDDGLLDICLIRKTNLMTGLKMLPGAARGHIIENQAVSVLRSSDIRFVSDLPVAYHLDGEPGILDPGLHRVRVLTEKLLFRRPV